MLCGEEEVLAENGHRALAGRKKLEEEQVIGMLAALPRPGAVLASRAHPWPRFPAGPLGSGVSGVDRKGRASLYTACRSPEWKLLILAQHVHFCKEAQNTEEITFLRTTGRESVTLVCVSSVSLRTPPSPSQPQFPIL